MARFEEYNDGKLIEVSGMVYLLPLMAGNTIRDLELNIDYIVVREDMGVRLDVIRAEQFYYRGIICDIGKAKVIYRDYVLRAVKTQCSTRIAEQWFKSIIENDPLRDKYRDELFSLCGLEYKIPPLNVIGQ